VYVTQILLASKQSAVSPDDGQEGRPNMYSTISKQNKLEKSVHLVGLTIEI